MTNDIRQHDKFTIFKYLYTENIENVDLVLEYINNTNWRDWNKVIDISKTLYELSAAFTSDSQVLILQNLVLRLRNTRELSEKQLDLLDLAVTEASYNVEWTKKRLPELLERMRSLPYINNAATIICSTTFLISLLVAIVVSFT